jgi:Fe-S cluster assembly iron-binding protein IscA
MVITDKAEKKLSEILTKAENKGKALKLYIAGFG